MACADSRTLCAVKPALATTYEGGDPDLLAKILPLVDYLEISPDTIARMDNGLSARHPAIVAEYQSVASQVKMIAHGVGLSIGSHDGCSASYIRLLDELFDKLPIEWHSEHLAYTMVDGENLGTMLALPRTTEVLDMVSERIYALRRRYGVPFLIEHVIRVLPDCAAEFSEACFLNALAANSGCGLILDVYNLECDAFNNGLNIALFLEELDLRHVQEIHIAGGVKYNGFQLDIHSRRAADSTLELAARVLARAPHVRALTYEFLREAVPSLGRAIIADELKRMRRNLLQ